MHLLLVTRSAQQAETKSLAEALSYGGRLNVGLRAPPPASGYQLTWYDIFVIYVVTKPADAILGRTYNTLISYIIEQIRAWYKKTREGHVRKRPLQFTIRNRIGRVVKAVTISDDGEKDVTSENRGTLVPPPTEEDFARRLEDPREFEAKLGRDKFRATVLFCDIANFSKLLGSQSMSVHRWMNACRAEWESIVDKQGGKLIYSHRDNLAAYFMEDRDGQQCTERAVSAAVAIAAVPARSKHRRLAKTRVRIGAATGLTSEYQLLSRRGISPVLQAAAALSIASRDSILIDSATRRYLGEGTFSLEYVGIRETVGDKRKRRIWSVVI